MAGFELRFSGAGGQGLQLSAKILSRALVLEGKRVAMSQAYEPTSRGGLSRSDLVVGEDEVDFPLATALDYLLVLDEAAAGVSDALIKPGALVIADARRVAQPPRGDFRTYVLPLSEAARALGNERVTNIISLAALAGLSGLCKRESLLAAIETGTSPKLLALNLEAVAEGYRIAAEAVQDTPLSAAG